MLGKLATKEGRPKATWRRTVEKDIKVKGGLCSVWSTEQEEEEKLGIEL